jgi:hypothetical protein
MMRKLSREKGRCPHHYYHTALVVALLVALTVGIPNVWITPTSATDPRTWTVGTWTEYSENPVFAGVSRAYYPSVLCIGETYHMWYTDGDYQTGYANSSDGIIWSSPTIVTGLTGKPGHAVVVNVGTEIVPHYRIWYADSEVWPYDVDLLRTAESDDGISWANDQPIGQINPLIRENNETEPAYEWLYGSYGPGAIMYDPDGYEDLNETDPLGNKYVMYYDQYTRHSLTGVNEVTMLAISVDGVNWKRYGDEPVLVAAGGSTAWDAQYAYAWSVLKLEEGYCMWYSGGIADYNDGIGYATSSDGLTWTKSGENPLMHVNDTVAWRDDRTYCPAVIEADGFYKMWFAGKDTATGNYRVGYATISAPLPDFYSIQSAIDAAEADDTIVVAAGTYNPTATIVIDKDNLILNGPQADVDPRPSMGSLRTAGSESEAIIDGGTWGLSKIIKVDADNVVINGLEIKSGTGDLIKQNSVHSGTTVKYCIIHDGRGDEGVQLKNCINGLIEYNYVYDIADPGDALSIADNSLNGVIRYNEVYNIDSENAAIYVYDSTGMEIVGNLVYHVTQNDGIKMGNKDGSDANSTEGLIKDNIVYDTEQDGITVYMSGVTIEGNNVYNSRSENGAIYIAYNVTGITICYNSIHDNVLKTSKWVNAAGILLEDRVNAGSVIINFNNIYNNEPFGVTNEASGLLDAALNWWGAATGPDDEDEAIDGDGDSISERVVADPWLHDSYGLSMEEIVEPEGKRYGSAPKLTNFGFDTAIHNLDSGWYRLDSGSWTLLFVDEDVSEWNNDNWEVPGFKGLTEGNHTGYFKVNDVYGHESDVWSWQFYKDKTAPTVSNSRVNPDSGTPGTEFTITTDVEDPAGIQSVRASIQKPDETEVATVELTGGSGYSGIWDSTGVSEGTYYVDITATDKTGNSIEEENAVHFPILAMPVINWTCKCVPANQTGYEFDAKNETDTGVLIDTTTGTPTVTVACCEPKNATGFACDVDKYIDVHLDDSAGVTSIEVRIYYTCTEVEGLVEADLRLYWWNGATWKMCSNTGVNTIDCDCYSGYIWAKITADTEPSLSDLTGTPFGANSMEHPVGGTFGHTSKVHLLGKLAGRFLVEYWLIVIAFGMMILGVSLIVYQRKQILLRSKTTKTVM